MIAGCKPKVYVFIAGVMDAEEKVQFHSEFTTLIQSVVAERKEAASENSISADISLQSSTACRKLKKCVRDFVERHQQHVL